MALICARVSQGTHWVLMERHAMVSSYNTLNTHWLLPIDNNECSSSDTNDCNQICSNTPGSYVCYCNTGYELGLDDATCVGEYKKRVIFIIHC